MTVISQQIGDFLYAYPMMVIRPTNSKDFVIEGAFEFDAVDELGNRIKDCFELRIHVPANFPSFLPTVYEIGNRIPRKMDNHINEDSSLCLGSPLRLKMALAENASLISFATKCIVPFLWAHSKGEFLFGELPHGNKGLWEDYKDILGVKNYHQIIDSFLLASRKRRAANKMICPCGCGRRLGKCSFRYKIHSLRRAAPRSWYADHANMLKTQAI
jgi:hypothetical protein